MSKFSSTGAWQFARAAWYEASKDNLGLIAAGVAFYAFLAFVPILVTIVLTYGLVASPDRVAGHIETLTARMPAEAEELVTGQLRNIVETTNSEAGLGLAISMLVAIYGATKAAGGIITALNIVFDTEESRSFLRVGLVTLAITVGIVFAFLSASLGISVVNMLSQIVPELGGAAQFALQTGYWLAMAVAISLIISAIYRFAPDRPGLRWRWFTPGALFATVAWIAMTFGFSFFVRIFGSYNATYGSLAAVIIFLTWLFLSSYVILFGAELNSVLETRRRQRSRERK